MNLMAETTELLTDAYHLAVDQSTVWMQANYNFGNMVPDLSPDWDANRARAVALAGSYTTATQLVRMKPSDGSFIDLDKVDSAAVHLTDGFITTNPDFILHTNAADCGEIALSGFSAVQETNVIALLHASRRIVGDGGHLRALDYLLDTHNVDPRTLTARLAPSARADSYKFPDISPDQKISPLWKDYVYEDADGNWHVDFHQRTVDDLLDVGIPKDQIAVSGVDTVTDPAYFSHRKFEQGLQPIGGNGLLFALRGRCN